MKELPDLDDYCSNHFTYRDLICCGETCALEATDNTPRQADTWLSIRHLATTILDPAKEQFGSLILTYGLSTRELSNAIKRRAKKQNRTPNIYPSLDQHAGSELDAKGKLICSDQGMACDFYCEGIASEVVAEWIIGNCHFDKLYFYGSDKPVHISASSLNRKKVVLVRRKDRKVTPKSIPSEKFRELCHWVEVP